MLNPSVVYQGLSNPSYTNGPSGGDTLRFVPHIVQNPSRNCYVSSREEDGESPDPQVPPRGSRGSAVGGAAIKLSHPAASRGCGGDYALPHRGHSTIGPLDETNWVVTY